MSTARPTMFIGSSKEGLVVAEAVADQLQENLEITMWSNGPFGLGDGTLQSLLAGAQRYDFATLVLTPDDLTTSRETTNQSPRDNVIFEAGVFMGVLGSHRTFIVFDLTKQIRIPSDLAGITLVGFNGERLDGNLFAAADEACRKIKAAVRQHGARGRGSSSPLTSEQFALHQLQALPPYDVMISNKALDAFLDAWQDDDKAWKVHGWKKFHGGLNQRWRVHQALDGNAIISLKECGLALDAFEENGWHVHLWSYHGFDNQRWLIERLNDHSYKIARADTDLCLEARLDGRHIKVGLREWNDSDNQRWWINPASA